MRQQPVRCARQRTTPAYAVDVTMRFYVAPLPEDEDFDPLPLARDVLLHSECADMLRPLLARLSDPWLPEARLEALTATPVALPYSAGPDAA